MFDFCPNCGLEDKLQRTQIQEEIKVRGEVFNVQAAGFVCHKCETSYSDLDSKSDDPYAIAHEMYRSKHSFLDPEEIKQIRLNYELTQRELSGLLGWGDVTLSRYEKGQLPTEGHNKTLRSLANEPHVLMEYIHQGPHVLSDEKRERIVHRLKIKIEETYSIDRVYEERFGSYERDEYSGYNLLNLDKVYNLILLACENGEFTTKINKLLFYFDFKNFKDNISSITGLRYVRLPRGPVPDKYDFYLANMLDKGALVVEEVCFGEYVGQKYYSKDDPDITIFTEAEKQVIKTVLEKTRTYNCSEISNISHEEKAWIETKETARISYDFAKELLFV